MKNNVATRVETTKVIVIGDTYDFWKNAKDDGLYEKEKQNIADQISRVICKKFPQAEGNIEVIDIATPLTYERYTGAYHGSWMGIFTNTKFNEISIV